MTRDYWLAFAFVLCAYLVRTQGILLIVAMLAILLFERKWKPAVVMSAISLPFMLIFRTGGNYISENLMKDPYNVGLGKAEFGDLIIRLAQNFVLYVTEILPQALVPYSAWAGLCAVLGIVIVWLLIKGARR